jgi:putative transcriptional regulator
MDSLEGKFLVASPHMDDPNFRRTVVFIMKHDRDEAFGFIINRPTKLKLSELLGGEENIPEDRDQVIYHGGPVTGPLMALHDALELSEDLRSGLAVSIQKDTIVELLNRNDNHVRIFYGYAGWGPSQLDQELEFGGWLVVNASTEQIFSESDSLWESIVIEIGRDIMVSGIDKKQIPPDPSMN